MNEFSPSSRERGGRPRVGGTHSPLSPWIASLDLLGGSARAAIGPVFGVDRTLIADGTYWVVEADSRLVGCGGWSRRNTLFGGDESLVADPTFLDPANEPARCVPFSFIPTSRGAASDRPSFAPASKPSSPPVSVPRRWWPRSPECRSTPAADTSPKTTTRSLCAAASSCPSCAWRSGFRPKRFLHEALRRRSTAQRDRV